MFNLPPKGDRSPNLSSPVDGVFQSMHKKAKLASRRRGGFLLIPEIPAGLGLSIIEIHEKQISSYDRSDLIIEALGLPDYRASKEFDMDILVANAAIQYAVHSGFNLRSRLGRVSSQMRHLQYGSSHISYLETLGTKQPYKNIGVRAVTASRDTLLDEFLSRGSDSASDPEQRFNAATWIGESILNAQIAPTEETTYRSDSTD